MSIFFDVLSAINNPNQEASIDKLGEVTGSINEIASSSGLAPDAMQGILSSMGGALRSNLKDQATEGNNPLEGIMDQLTGGGGGNPLTGGMQSMVLNQLQGPLINAIGQKTGLDSSLLQGVVPKLLPAVMGLLNMGKTTPGAPGGGGNPLLKAFLDSDGDGDTDLGDVLKFSNRFLNPNN